MATKITRQILEAYLNCKTKAHLKLAGQQGIVSDYEALLVANRQAVRRQAIEKILARNPETEVARDISLTAAALGKGPSFVLNATLEDDLLSLSFDGLKRVDGPSKLGDFQYVPMLFHEGQKVGKKQRLLLEIYGLLLSRLQGQMPSSGIIWHGKECRTTVGVHRCSSSCFAEVVAREHGHHWTTIGVSGYGPWLISTSRSLIRCSRRGCRRHQRTYFRTSRS